MVAGVLIRTEPQKERQVFETLKKLEGLSYVYMLFGQYDLVALVRALDLDAAAIVVAKIREVDGVTYTETLVVRPNP